MNTNNITAIILTYNEERHIERCVKNAQTVASKVFLVDCSSTDRTRAIAEGLGATVVDHAWPGNHAAQLNWALENLPITTPWVMRLDADEYLTDELTAEINKVLPTMPSQTNGVYFKRRVYFMGRWIKHGGYYPTFLLRLWRHKKVVCEQRWMDEHMKVLEGTSVTLDHDFVDDNLNYLPWWTVKHNGYSSREAVELLNHTHHFMQSDVLGGDGDGSQEKTKRKLKENYYARLPLFLRALIYWKYRYFIKLGFLDGVPGLIWHFLQGFWYRFLVDAKIYQVERYAKDRGVSVKDAIREVLGIEIVRRET
ncbi:MAG TPA: glycosyltransferase family 2 protein [bacterium]|nr:glycosyltransferase family 2 protein [bacterium]